MQQLDISFTRIHCATSNITTQNCQQRKKAHLSIDSYMYIITIMQEDRQY